MISMSQPSKMFLVREWINEPREVDFTKTVAFFFFFFDWLVKSLTWMQLFQI